MPARNAAFQRVETLRRNRAKRTHERCFVVEGVRPLEAAIRFGWEFDEVWWAPAAGPSRWAARVVERARAATVVETSPELLAELSDREEPSEVVAVCRMRDDGEVVAALRPDGRWLAVVLDRPASPGNLGSVIRSADALGASCVLVSGHAADPHDPRAVRASMGSLFAVPVARLAGPAAVLELCARWRAQVPELRVLAASAEDGDDPERAGLGGPLALVLGNEARGLAHAFAEGCDGAVRIPTRARFADSLNVAAAAAILLHEAARGRT